MIWTQALKEIRSTTYTDEQAKLYQWLQAMAEQVEANRKAIEARELKENAAT